MPINFFFGSESFDRLRAKALNQPVMRKLFDPVFLDTHYRNANTALEAKKTFALVMLGLWLEAFGVEVSI